MRRVPDEMAADRAAQLDRVADLDHVVEEGRHFAIRAVASIASSIVPLSSGAEPIE